jgi:hypothetical protein
MARRVFGIDQGHKTGHSIYGSVEERFGAFIEPSESGCWIWTRGLTHNGYGAFLVKRNPHARAHRWAWMLFRGPIPIGLFVLHKCDVRRCVNPDHLFLGTARDNTTDAINKGRPIGRPRKAA